MNAEPKEIWLKIEKKGNYTMYILKTRDPKMASAMLNVTELLECLISLETALSAYYESGEEPPYVLKARTVISKATGGE